MQQKEIKKISDMYIQCDEYFHLMVSLPPKLFRAFTITPWLNFHCCTYFSQIVLYHSISCSIVVFTVVSSSDASTVRQVKFQ